MPCPFLRLSLYLAICWFGYINDGLTVARCGFSDHLRLFLNSWHPSTQWDVTVMGLSVPDLDLRITIAGSSLSFTTFRKAQNSCSYLPRSSCHPRSVFNALISGEVVRLSRHNYRNSHALTRELEFFVDRLGKRGYNKDDSRQTSTPLCTDCNEDSSRRRKPSVDCASSSKSTRGLGTRRSSRLFLKRDWHVIQRIFPLRCDIVLSFRIQPNDCRRNYATTWLKSVRPRAGERWVGSGFLYKAYLQDDARFQHAVSALAVRIAAAYSRALDLNKPLSGRNTSFVVLRNGCGPLLGLRLESALI